MLLKLAESIVFSCKWLIVKKEKIQTSNGFIIEDYFTIKSKDSVNVFALTLDKNVVVNRISRLCSGMDSLELPCGLVEDGEEPEMAIKRELLEETGYLPEDIIFTGVVFSNPANNYSKNFCFFAINCVKNREPEVNDENISTTFISIKEFEESIYMGNVVQSLHISSFFLAKKYFKKLNLII
jgi:ADP-ribose pyrophosphatase